MTIKDGNGTVLLPSSRFWIAQPAKQMHWNSIVVWGNSRHWVEYLYGERCTKSGGPWSDFKCAGASDSAKLLMPGIGDAEHLQAMGISVVVDLPGVGQNLQEHSHRGLPGNSGITARHHQ